MTSTASAVTPLTSFIPSPTSAVGFSRSSNNHFSPNLHSLMLFLFKSKSLECALSQEHEKEGGPDNWVKYKTIP